MRTIDWLENINNFGVVVQVVGGFVFIFWLAVIWWVWLDSVKRFKNAFVQFVMGLVVIVFPIFGLFIYLLVRPTRTTEENYFIDLEKKVLLSESFDLNICEKCQYVLPGNFIRCPGCGGEVRHTCLGCKEIINVRYEYCPFCGKKQEKNGNIQLPNDNSGKGKHEKVKGRFSSISGNIQKVRKKLFNSIKVTLSKRKGRKGNKSKTAVSLTEKGSESDKVGSTKVIKIKKK